MPKPKHPTQTASTNPAEIVEIKERRLNYRSTYDGAAADGKARAPFKDRTEAKFIAEKREAGFTDEQIVKMLGRTVEFIRRPDHVDDSNSVAAPQVVDEVTFSVTRRIPVITPEERRQRDRAARKSTTWRPGQG
ncbi:MAG: hypothetical protein C0481_12305 [Phenylobacterium sp.]|nr:hypothetical protein [Phenylobacterium sp.]